MKKFKKLLEKKWFALTFALCVAVLFFVVLSNLPVVLGGIGAILEVLKPVIGGLVFAFLVNPVMVFFEKKPFKGMANESARHVISMVVALLCVFGVLGLLLLFIIPTTIDSVQSLVASTPAIINNAYDIINEAENIFISLGFDFSLQSSITDYVTDQVSVAGNAISNLSNIVSTSVDIGSEIMSVAIGFIISLYFLAGKRRLLYGIEKFRMYWLGKEKYEVHTDFINKCYSITIRFVGCDLLDGLIVGVVNAIFMLIAHLPFVPVISLLVGITNLVPTFGPIVGGFIGGVLLLFVNPWYAVAFIIFTLILQTVDGYIIKPKLFGDVLGIPPVWILVSIILGGALFKVVGMLVAIPVAAIISLWYKEFFYPYIKARRKRLDNEKSEKK